MQRDHGGYEDDPCIEGNEHLLEDYRRGYADGHDAGLAEGYAKAHEEMRRKTDEEMARHREQIRRLTNGE